MSGKSSKVVIDLIAGDGARHKKTIQFVASGYNLLFNAQHLLIQLSPRERAFFDYLCERMRFADNDVYIDKPLKADFINHIERITSSKMKITEVALAKYVQKLAQLGLIIPTQDKARYIVNPKYAYKCSSGARLKHLKLLIESRIKIKLPIQHLIAEPEEVFLRMPGKNR